VGRNAWSAYWRGRAAAGVWLTRRGGARSFASSSTNFQDLAHLADVGASMSSGTDAALQEVLEELSVPARRAPPPPRPAPGPRPPAPARSEAPTGGPARRQAADIAARRRRPSDTSTTCSSVDVELQHESLTNLWRMAGGGGSGRRGRTRGLRRARARARAQGGGHAAAAEEGDRAVQAAGRDREARGGEDQQGPAALLPHRAAAQHQEGAGPGEG